ncbi:MAG: isoamylase early set domain-containing protein [Spirochaetales bacterium]|nr:isoamylase early set domain-containing protein [Spirochaetales bacterium]
MSLVKKFLKTKPECKVTFVLDKEACKDGSRVNLVGDFNEWDKEVTVLKKNKNGDYSVTLDLETGKDYHYRYLIDGEKWVNDWEADYYAPTEYNSENSVVRL